jgi:beta-phosphoglucomutase family hydrolase
MRATAEALGLPARTRACLFDLDGVLTNTASLHAQAWRQMFDEFLHARADAESSSFVPFDAREDYDRYVDGKPRLDGARDFLASRRIKLPLGDESDASGTPTVWGLGNRKNDLVLNLIRDRGVEVFDGSRRYLEAVRRNGLSSALVTSSTNATEVLAAAGLSGLFDARIDGKVARDQKLAGKPAPDTFLAAAAAVGAVPGSAVVFEDALAGVAAGRAGHFGYVVGVDRIGQAEELREHGADIVVRDLADLIR